MNKRKQAPAQLRYAPLGSLKYQPAKPVRCQASYALPVGRAFTQQLQWMFASTPPASRAVVRSFYYLLALRKKGKERFVSLLPSAPLWAVTAEGAGGQARLPSSGKSPSALSRASSCPYLPFSFYALATPPSNPFRMPLHTRSCLPFPPSPGQKKAFKV